MNPETIIDYCDQIDGLTQAIRDELATAPEPPTPPDGVVVAAGGDLQAALDAGGPVTLTPASAFFAAGGYTFTQPVTTLTGDGGNTVEGDSASALRIPPEIDQIGVEALAIVADTHAALQIGRNDSEQVLLERAPTHVRLRAVTSIGHRGKRAFEVNAAHVELLDCEVHDCYSAGGQDSQAIWIGNAPGPVTVTGGYFEGASENLMVGGDTMKIPNCRPTGITVSHAVFHKPLAWKDAGTPKVKNLFELKDGLEVLVEDCELAYCWKSGQDGYALMCTPSQGGAVSVVFKNCRVHDVGGIVNITGTDASAINTRRSQVSILGGEYRTNKVAMGGSGRFCLATRGPEWIIVESALIAHEGSAFCDLADDKQPIDLLRIVNSTWNYGSYGIRIGGANHGDNTAGVIRTIEITGNTISGAHSSFKSRYPDNLYLDSMSRDREHKVDGQARAYASDVLNEIARVHAWESEYRLGD